ncbi:MAG: transcription factor [Euryarchaeota archaeon]|nr:transcription factor [Euryarchaeota archaeon]
MKTQNTTIVEFLEDLLGKGGVEIASFIEEEKATDEKIAEKLGLRINVVRRVLYRLYDNRLATYIRTRDKKTGWYVYYWKLNLENAPKILNSIEKDYIEHLEETLKYEENNMFFSCENSCNRYAFPEAEELKFKCPDCDEPLEHHNNAGLIKTLKMQIEELKDKKKENNGEK